MRLTSLNRMARGVRAPTHPVHGYFESRRDLPWPAMTAHQNFTRKSTDELAHGPKQHHRFVLLLVLEGAGTSRIDGVETELRKNDALLILPRQVHSFFFARKAKLLWHFSTFESLPDPRWERFRGARFRLDSLARDVLSDTLAHEAHEKSSRSPRGEALAWILSRIEASLPSSAQTLPADRDDAIDRFLEAGPDVWKGKGTGELAARMGMGRTAFLARFRERFGVPLATWLRRDRIHRSTTALLEGRQTLSRIAVEAGFSGLDPFRRAYQKEMGESPAAWRNRMRSTRGETS